jgi:hypothetical protein
MKFAIRSCLNPELPNKDRVKRRDFVMLLGGAVAVWPLGARAQQAVRPLIGFLSPISCERS